MRSRRERQVWGACGQPVCDRKIKTGILSRPQGGRRPAPQTGRLRPGHSPCVASVSNRAGWLLTDARGINAKGQIVGYGFLESALGHHNYNRKRAFLLMPQ